MPSSFLDMEVGLWRGLVSITTDADSLIWKSQFSLKTLQSKKNCESGFKESDNGWADFTRRKFFDLEKEMETTYHEEEQRER